MGMYDESSRRAFLIHSNILDRSKGKLLIRTIFCLLSVLSTIGMAVGQQPKLPVNVGVYQQEVVEFYTTEHGLPSNDVLLISAGGKGGPGVITAEGQAVFTEGVWGPTAAPLIISPEKPRPIEGRSGGPFATEYLSRAEFQNGDVAIGDQAGLQINGEQVFPNDQHRRWAPTTVKVAVDGLNRLWFCCDQGVGCLEDGNWTLYTGADGLPYDEFTSMAAGSDGVVWFGTTKGVVRYDGDSWAYRQGKRWLPDDDVRDIAVDADGAAWVATAAGVAKIYFRDMTLAEKADYYESEIDQHNRRTEFGYVIEAHAATAGDKTTLKRTTSDNDGLWTSMYGAGECFAYGATKDPNARRRAKDAFAALKFLSEAPKGSPHEPPAGFIARTVLETSSDRDPNAGAYTLEGQRKMQERDKQWRVYEPRWPKSADGQWYWKSDTSSDELDGHYFFNVAYYDLVAETEDEKSAVREVVRANIDHLIAHDFSLYDHAGRSRWAVYDPQELNFNPKWFVERGLNSISILSYLNVAFHVTRDEKYRDVAKELRDRHSYHINALTPKLQKGIGTGNQSDDEMAFMAFYNLIKYEPDPELRTLYLSSFAGAWRLEEPELNPFFNFCFAAVALGESMTNNWGEFDLSPWPTWLADSVDTLKRFPLDRFDWAHNNSHRNDLIMLTKHSAEGLDRESSGRGYRVNGKVLPVEREAFQSLEHRSMAFGHRWGRTRIR